MKQPMFPIMRDDVIKAIPWASLAPHEKQAKSNHSQTLNRLAQRGGLNIAEAVAILEDRPWHTMDRTLGRVALCTLIQHTDKEPRK